MKKPEAIFRNIINQLPEANEGKMFGALCIKAINGKVATILWKETMLFKLDKAAQQEALQLEGAKIGSHLYDSNKPMKGWICLPLKHSEAWIHFSKKAIAFVETLKK